MVRIATATRRHANDTVGQSQAEMGRIQKYEKSRIYRDIQSVFDEVWENNCYVSET